MDLRGSLDVLRNGFTDYGVKFRMAFFKPETGMNAETIALYNQNRLKVVRQVYYSQKNTNSIDLVLAVNGLPVVTMELKNQFTGQTTKDAKRQYATTRDNRELLFAFKKRALVHFAVDPDEVYMAGRQQDLLAALQPGPQQRQGQPAQPQRLQDKLSLGRGFGQG